MELLRGHDVNKPVSLGNVTQWAAKRGLLANEALAYESIKNERRAAAANAEQAVLTERLAAWATLKAETAQANESGFDAATLAISTALLNVERAKGRQGQAFHKRMMMQNAIESLKPRR